MSKKWKITIHTTAEEIEFIRLKKGNVSRNFTPGNLDFSPLSWEEVKGFYKTNLHNRFVLYVRNAINKVVKEKIA